MAGPILWKFALVIPPMGSQFPVVEITYNSKKAKKKFGMASPKNANTETI
jgi:hypothetical protein